MTADAAATRALTRRHESSAANTFRLVSDPPVFVRGEGPYLFTETGVRYLDLVCGSATTSLGHNHPAHRAALETVLATGILHTGTRLPSPFRASLYKELVSILPAGLDCIHLANSGAEAVETAIKAAQFATDRHRLVAFEGGYHGRTLGALSLTHGPRIRAPFSTLDALVDRLPYPNATNPVTDCLGAAEALFVRRKAEGDLPALIVVEAVQAVSGIHGPDRAFLQGLAELAGEFGIPLALDEIWNGFGRTGRWFAFEHAGLTPDMVIIGKSFSGGLPLAAVAAGRRFLKEWPPGMHTSTFQGNPLACAMAVAGIETIRADGLLGHVETSLAPLLQRALAPLMGQAGVADIRVAGAQAAIQLAASDGTPDPDRAARLQREMLDRHILVYGGGMNGDCLMLVPPIIVSPGELEPALNIIVNTIRASAP